MQQHSDVERGLDSEYSYLFDLSCNAEVHVRV